MADEAILHIRLEGQQAPGAGAATGSAPGGAPAGRSPGPSRPPQVTPPAPPPAGSFRARPPESAPDLTGITANLPEIPDLRLPEFQGGITSGEIMKILPAIGGQLGGIVGGLAAAAGPAAIVIGVVKALEYLKSTVVETIRSLGEFALSFASASDDPSRFVTAIGSALTTFSDKIFLLSPALSLFAAELGEVTNVLGSFMREMDGMVNRYAQFSPALAQAQAIADVAQVMNEIRRSREATPALIQYLRARTELQQRYEDAKIAFINTVMPLAVDGMKLLTVVLPFIQANLILIVEALKNTPIVGEWLRNVLRAIEENTRKETEDTTLNTELILSGIFPFEGFKPGQRTVEGTTTAPPEAAPMPRAL